MNHQSNAGITFYTLLGLALIWAISYPLAMLSRGTHATSVNALVNVDCHTTECNHSASHETHGAVDAK